MCWVLSPVRERFQENCFIKIKFLIAPLLAIGFSVLERIYGIYRRHKVSTARGHEKRILAVIIITRVSNLVCTCVFALTVGHCFGFFLSSNWVLDLIVFYRIEFAKGCHAIDSFVIDFVRFIVNLLGNLRCFRGARKSHPSSGSTKFFTMSRQRWFLRFKLVLDWT